MPATNVQLAWLKSMVLPAQTTARAWRVPASVTLAQCICESAWGTSQLSRQANNYFGIKAVAGATAYVELPTHEVVAGKTVSEMAKFARFGTVVDCFAAHAHLLDTLPRYAPAMAHAGDPFAFARQLQLCGYSTNPDYAAELGQLIRHYNLQQYDVDPSPETPAAMKEAA